LEPPVFVSLTWQMTLPNFDEGPERDHRIQQERRHAWSR
jgi:hypothetical protein